MIDCNLAQPPQIDLFICSSLFQECPLRTAQVPLICEHIGGNPYGIRSRLA